MHFKDDKVAGYQLFRESLALMPTVNALSAMIDAPGTTITQAEEYVRQVLELDPDNDHARASLGVRHALHGRSRYGRNLLKEAQRWGEPYASDLLSNMIVRLILLGRLIIRLGF